MPKNLQKEEVEDAPVADDALLDGAADLGELPAAPAAGPVPGKRALGVKEPIIFKWKLIGTSQHMTFTLFKAVEREEVDAQLERLQKEGYYTDLKILDADAKVVQPVQPKGAKKAAPRSAKASPAPPTTRPSAAKRSSPTTISVPRRSATAKSALKSAVKPMKKKPVRPSGKTKAGSKKK